MKEQDRKIDGSSFKDALKPSYAVTELPFTDEKGRNFSMSYVKFSGQIGDFPEDPFVQGLIEGITPVSDTVFPETLPGHDLHESHIKLVNGCNSIAVIRAEGSDRIIGFHLFDRKRLDGTDYSLIDLHAAGVHPDFQGGKVMQKSREELLRLEDPDIAYGSTIHPAIYKSYQTLASDLSYTFYPTSANTPLSVVEFVRYLLRSTSGEKAAATLDDTFVKRDHLPIPVQGYPVPYIGYKFFEQDLNVHPTDGVALLLVKPEVAQLFEQPVLRRQPKI